MTLDPTTPLTLFAALAAGLLGSAHCMGMCGGVAGALGMSAQGRGGTGFALLYNLGRIISYATAGALAGLAGAGLAGSIDGAGGSGVLRVAAGLLAAAIGLHLATGWRGLRFIETAGARVWKRIAPLARRLIPVEHPVQALGLGMLWGWLPCGLVYTMLLAAAVSASPTRGALVMTAFGLGTAPAMVAAALAATRLARWTHRSGLRLGAGALLIVFGLWTAAAPLIPVHGDHHEHEQVAAESG